MKDNPLLKEYESKVSMIKSLIMPYFVISGRKTKLPLIDMPGIYGFSSDLLISAIEKAVESGISSVILFDIVDKKEKTNSFLPATRFSILPKAIAMIKRKFPRLTVISDLCVCSGTISGQCRLIQKEKYSTKKTMEALKVLAVSCAEKGVDIISPSGMLKDETTQIRHILNKSTLTSVRLMPCIKFASHLYLPARKVFGVKNTTILKPYHLPLHNHRKALQKIEQEINQGADIIMIKPALYNLDIIYTAKKKFNIPFVGFMPSGTYQILKKGTRDNTELEKNIIFEELCSLRRAGCSGVATYYASQIAGWFKGPH